MQEPARGRGPHEQTLTGRLSINQLTLDQSTFEEDLESCRRIGASGIGIVENKLGDGRDQELAELIEGAGLQATLCTAGTPTLLPVALFGGPTDPQVRIEQLIASIARFAPFRPAQFITLTGVDDSLSDADQRRTVVDGYRRVSAAAADVGALVGIEPIRRSAAADASLVVTVAETADLVAEIDAPNVGIIYDVFHHWDSPTLLEDIAAHASQFSIVQLGDLAGPADVGFSRAIPGEGRIPLSRIFAALEAAGYTGWFDVELLSEGSPDSPTAGLDNDEILARTMRGLEAAWESRALSPEAGS